MAVCRTTKGDWHNALGSTAYSVVTSCPSQQTNIVTDFLTHNYIC